MTKQTKPRASTHTDRAIYDDIKERALLMRQNPTPAEAVLWKRLRRKQIRGLHFRRQHPINRFIVDFFCPAARLVIEIDGSVHNDPGQREYDQDRQQFLEQAGFKVLRFTNEQTLRETDAVIEAITRFLSKA